MQSPNQSYIPECDQLRALATLLVFFYHALYYGLALTGAPGWRFGSDPFTPLLYEGHTGVSLFMVLSGFILARGSLYRVVNYKQFMKNRLLRIVPLMTLVVIFAIYGSRPDSLSNIISPFLLLWNTKIHFNDTTNLAGSIWAISVLFQLYLIAPLLFAFTSKDGLKFLIPATVLILLLKLIVLKSLAATPDLMVEVPYYTIVGRLNQFLLGIGLAYFFPRFSNYMRDKPRLALYLLAAAFAGILAFAFAINNGGGWARWQSWRGIQQEIEAYIWAAFIALFIVVRPIRWAPVDFALRRIGTWSFSIYILHWPLMVLFWDNFGARFAVGTVGSVTAINAVALMPIVLGISALSYFCVERPFLGLRGRYLIPDDAMSARPIAKLHEEMPPVSHTV